MIRTDCSRNARIVMAAATGVGSASSPRALASQKPVVARGLHRGLCDASRVVLVFTALRGEPMHRTFVRSWFQAALALGFIAAALPARAEVAGGRGLRSDRGCVRQVLRGLDLARAGM